MEKKNRIIMLLLRPNATVSSKSIYNLTWVVKIYGTIVVNLITYSRRSQNNKLFVEFTKKYLGVSFGI